MSINKDKITSFVKGFPISLTIKELGECLKITYVGVEIKINHDYQLENYVKKDFYYVMSTFFEDGFFQNRIRTCGKILEHNLW